MSTLETTMDGKPDLDQPVRVTHLNQAIDVVEKKADQEYAASREWKFHAGMSSVLGLAGVAVGIATTSAAAPLLAAPLAAVGISVFAAKKIKEGALREVAQEMRAGQTLDVDHADGSKPDLNNPVKITGMSQAVDVLDRKSKKSMKAAKGWLKGAVLGGIVATGLALTGIAPAAVLGYTAVMGAMAGYNYMRGKTFEGLKAQFNQNAARGGTQMATAPAVKESGPKPTKPSGWIKL